MSEAWVTRMGKSIPADEVFHAWTSGDLDRMLGAIAKPTNLIDRHFLLLGIVQATYKRRREPQMRAIFLKIARQHLDEFKDIAPALRIDMGGFLPRVPTFQHLATVLAEDGEYRAAIQVCRTAIAFGLCDGTRNDFEGRISRIEKKLNEDDVHRG